MGLIVGYHGFVDSNNQGFLINNLGNICTSNFLDWIVRDHFGDEYKKVAYDIDAFTAILLRLIGINKEQGNILHDREELWINNYQIKYFPAKFLGIGYGTGWGRPYASFSDISQYYDNPTLNFEPTKDNCQKVAQSARDLAARVSKSLFELGLNADTLTSPISSLDKTLLSKLDLPTHKDCPADANDYALKCCPGNLVQVYAQGHFHNCTDLDLSGAYSSFLAELFDTRRGEWIEGERPDNAVYGFAHGYITTQAPLHPFIYSIGGEGGNFTPVGSWETYLTLNEIDFMRDYKIGEFEFIDGWWWYPTGKDFKGERVTDKMNQPMKGIVNYIFQKRLNATPLTNKLLKRMASGLWGRTLSRIGGEYSKTFMPVWGSLVEANTRIEVIKFCLDNNIIPLSVAVDGIVTDKPIEIENKRALGKWRISHKGNCLLVGSGTVGMEQKPGQGDFGFEYDWIIEQIKNNPNATEYSMRKVICNTLGRSLNLNFDKLGTLEESTKTIHIGQENKRLYFDNPRTGNDLNNNQYFSEPLDISMCF